MLPNSMHRLLAPLGSNLKDEETTMASIKDSLRNSFAVVGLTEKFEETLLLLKRKGILDDISFRKHKVLHNQRLTFHDLPPATQQKIIQHNRLDQELFDFAKELLETTLREQDASFWTELEEFKQHQQQRMEQFGECEDDGSRFGGWLCDPESRQAWHAKRLEEKKRSLPSAEQKNDPEYAASEGIARFIREAFKPRYW